MMFLRALIIAALVAGTALQAHAFEAGAAKVEITPPIGTPMNGYGARFGRPSTGVHDPLWARALYLDDGETKLFLVNTDLCMINAELRERVLALAPAEVPKENILLTATHTHSAQGAMHRHLPLRFVAGKFSQEVLDGTARNIVASMRGAYDARKRASIGYGTGTQKDLSRNRRVADGPIDEQIGVIEVDDADGNAIAVVTNFAAHPTYVEGADFYSFSADYVGFYYAEMERLAGEGSVALFLNGAEGNQSLGNPENKEGWERLASIGRLLAERTKAVMDKIDCAEVPLRLTHAQPELPLSLAKFQPRSVFLSTLEIGDLAIAFMPGEPVVEIGLELRRRALAQGYKAHMTVGLSNDYLNYFVTRELYPGFYYETAMNFFGPGIADWFYQQFGTMYSRGEKPAALALSPIPAKGSVAGGALLRTEGSARAQGQQRGQAFAEDIREKYITRIEQAIASGATLPKTGVWGMMPPFIDSTALMPAFMGMALRARLKDISPALYAEVEGIAEGAGLPFDAVWLLQNARDIALHEDKTPFFNSPLCTMFAVVKPNGVLVGRNLDWDLPELPVVTQSTPEGDAQATVQVGFSWNAGIFTGMNAAGLVLCLQRIEGLGEPDPAAIPLELVLRDLLADKKTVSDAVAALSALPGQHGHHVLVAGREAEGFGAAVVEFAKTVVVRKPEEDGILLGVSLLNEAADEDTLVRNARVMDLLSLNPAHDRAALQAVLVDAEPGRAGKAKIWNESTKHAVVIDPAQATIYTAFPKDDGTPGAFEAVKLVGGATP